MFRIRKYFTFIIVVLIVYPSITVAQNNINAEQNQTAIKPQKSVNSNGEHLHPILEITPLEINARTVTADKSGEGTFTLKNTGSGVIDRSTDGPEGWEKSEKQKLSGVTGKNADSLRVEVRLLPGKPLSGGDSSPNVTYDLEMKLESGGGKLTCRKQFPVGAHKEAIKINSAGEQKQYLSRLQ